MRGCNKKGEEEGEDEDEKEEKLEEEEGRQQAEQWQLLMRTDYGQAVNRVG